MLIQRRELLDINAHDSKDQQCQDILTNWEIVCEENDYEKEFVTDFQWNQWMSFRNKIDGELVRLSDSTLSEIHDYLTSLNNRITGARRINMEEEERKKRSIELDNKPSRSLIQKLLSWR